jgi:hypothetical protein
MCTQQPYQFWQNPEVVESFVPSGSGILVVGVDNVTVKDNNISDNNLCGHATVSTLLGQLPACLRKLFADIEPNPDGAKIINNVLINNGAPPCWNTITWC